MGFLSDSGLVSPGVAVGGGGGFGLAGQLMARIAEAEKQKAGPRAAAKAEAPQQQQQAAPDPIMELQALNDELTKQYGTNVDAMRKDPRYARVAKLAETHKSVLPKINQAAWNQMAAKGQ
jgi:hypothetical protein